MKKYVKKILIGLLISSVLAGGVILSLNFYVVAKSDQYILAAKDVPEADAILVLGAYVYPDGGVSTMLRDRLLTGYDLYEMGKSDRILVSGDHGRKDYDEVNTMKNFLKDKGVPGKDVFMDHAGFNTYDSVYRARDIFGVKRVIIVTQEYHLKRALFIARSLGLEAYGVAADRQDYGPVMLKYTLREIVARDKDFFTAALFQPEPTFLGDAIPVSGDGSATDD